MLVVCVPNFHVQVSRAVLRRLVTLGCFRDCLEQYALTFSTVFSGYLGSCLEQCGLTGSSASLVNWVKFRDCLEQCGLNVSISG
jgi:hypothetical protein